MGCNCDNNKEELRIVRGNSFHLRVQVTARRLDGTVIDDFDLGAADPVLKMIYGGSATAKNMIVEGNDAIIYFDGKDKLGWYGMEMSGTYESEAWRWCVEKVFQIVNTNAKGNVPEWAFFADDTYIVASLFDMVGIATAVQSDWDETDPTSPAFILNKPDLNYYGTVVNRNTSTGVTTITSKGVTTEIITGTAPMSSSATILGVTWEAMGRQIGNSTRNKADKVSNATEGNFAGLNSAGNLVDSGSKPSDFATAAQGAKADTAYQLPNTGIPSTDLSASVQASLTAANNAAPQSNTYTKGDVDTKLARKADKVVNATSGNFAGLDNNGNLIDSHSKSSDFATAAQGAKADEAAPQSTTYTKTEVDSALAGKQNTISDLTNIRSGAALGATAYQKPSGGIPSTDLASSVQASLTAADNAAPQSTTYTKTEVDNLIVPANTTIQVVTALPATGTANTIYRVAGDPNAASYTDYGWDGNQFVPLAVNSNTAAVLTAPQVLTDAQKIQVANNIEIFGTIEQDADYIRAYTDADGKVLAGIKKDGSVDFARGIPSSIHNYVVEKVDAEEERAIGVENNKVDKVAGKGLSTNDYTNSDKEIVEEFSIEQDEQYIQATTDNEGKILEAIKQDGTKFIPKLYFGGLDKIESDINYLRAFHPLNQYGTIACFVDDDSGKYFPDTWGEIMSATDIRIGIACITGYMAGVATPPPVYEQMTLAQLQGYYNGGCEVYSHSWLHPSFRNTTLERIEEECWESRDWLNANGFTRNSDVIVYPGGMNASDADEKIPIIRRNYRYGVATTEEGNGVNNDPINEYFITRCNADSHTLEYLKERVDEAIRLGRILVVITHAYELMGLGTTSLSTDKDVNIQRVIDLINYIQLQNVPILPLEETLHQVYGWH